jgi:subtilisin family serine protease
MKKIITVFFSILIIGNTFGQTNNIDDFDVNTIDWYNKDLSQDIIMGTSVDKAYSEILKDLIPKKTVVVAVIDGGVDIYHKDLEGKIWVNTDEIPDNKIDDDNNGYIDDVNGWNFLGNDSGEIIYYENLEYTRIVKSKNENAKDYEKAKKLYEDELTKRKTQKNNYYKFKEAWENAKLTIKENTDVTVQSQQDLLKINSKNEAVLRAKNFLSKKYSQGVDENLINRLLKTNAEYLDYFLNVDFNARELIGDDILNFDDRYYGNNNVKGSRSDHGTTVAGVIAAQRDNGIGINGIAENVQIMVLCSTPKGDERDKDVALSIIYAVDNGADIINMSFSKEFSPQKDFVDQAVRYAEEKGVLIVHGAGNKGQSLDLNERFPSDIYLDMTEPTNWLNVGATTIHLDEEVIGIFSNYGINHVDIFAPGVDIVSLDSSNTYIKISGTSIAAPILTGISALILSYYPDLTPKDLITILMESSYKVTKPKKVLTPSLSDEKRIKAKFSTLSKSGGIVNAYNAFKYIDINQNN